ncbi:MAG: hypothetical protein A2651_02325 [Candidatus Yanofskybacteria bacterium RIFCSPHIGHO2_01_FULL_42_12]|uniref:Glycosyl transferase family 1 domain-containing protein n=1 Tax=Candidatus Yanofskybacteria bacterium RIFCSPLOWO2_01_FULL_42_49 TaxID=1802694 RepID=A0A1F8GCL0_9BACT|nr:MAG: hypothetical protein A2651_02325 [Candidatus Yanofskybacteria bacterium RIFCSPHIGHO2_01_FULL_42_12]OGN22790.1 MAG: hypothetical protein A2918_01480 [Candidatus Yanofskybacteria bacterium RIFCSPLOWO2_01_FULL_42_49]
MLKIGIECENLEDPKSRWGIGKITLNLLKEFAKNPEWQKKYKLYLYFKSRIPNDEVLKSPIFVKRVSGFPSFNIFYHILMPLRAMVDRVNWMFFPAYQLPPLYLGKSIVVLTEDAYYEYKYGTLPFRYKLSYRIFTNWAAKFATKILAISETSKKELARIYKINPDKIFVNYLGIDTLPFFAQSFEGRQTQGNYLLFVGQMFPRRHAKETILAFEKLLRQSSGQVLTEHSNILQNVGMSELKLILIGPDKYPDLIINPLVAQVNKQLGREAIVHKDYVKDEELVELYARARALVYVSDREAFGLPPMEALSFGVPPIVMDNELGHELFEDHAFYSKSGEVDDIADTIKQALSDDNPSAELRARIKSDGSEFVKKYNWKSFADCWFQIINEK